MHKYTNVIDYTPHVEIDDNSRVYRIIGRSTTGSRHYSELLTADGVMDEFDKYLAVVEYFGGGEAQIWENGELVYSEFVF